MKRTLMALAALSTLAAAGTAAAQSSVTLFGVVDAALSEQSTTTRQAATGFSSRTGSTTLSNSGYNASRIGFRGTEDLGGGLAASFWLEAPIGNDDGATGIASFSRRSTVSLSGGFGELRAGRDYTATYWNDTAFDPFGTHGAGASLISLIGGGTALGNPDYARASNMVGYFLPSNLGGFYGQVQYGLSESTSGLAGSASTGLATTADTSTTTATAGHYAGGRFGYANGPFDIALSYGRNTVADSQPFARRLQTANLGASYDFGPVKLFGEISEVRNTLDVAGTRDDHRGYLLGASMPVGAGLVRASYALVSRNGHAALGLDDDDQRSRKLSLGYVHNLSKRTALYATVARQTDRSPLDGSTSKTGMGYDLGISHAF